MNLPRLTLYFDSQCRLCATEMARLRLWDRRGALAFVDIAADGFDPAPLGVDLAALDRELHAMTAEGRLLKGIDSIVAAYTLAGRGWIVLPLRLRALRGLWSALYRRLARNRYRVSDLLGFGSGQRCAGGACTVSGSRAER